jgi:hypothetical protein
VMDEFHYFDPIRQLQLEILLQTKKTSFNCKDQVKRY